MDTRRPALHRWALPGTALLATLLLATACQPADEAGAATEPAPPPDAEEAAEAVAEETAEPVAEQPVEGLLGVEPASGPVGTEFTVSGDELPPGAEVEFVWQTLDGSFDLNVMPETIEFYEPVYTDTEHVLGRATADGQGRVSATFTAPEDYGGAHDIYAVVDGEPLARGGFEIRRQVTVTPTEGPVGTPITIEVTGLGSHMLERAMALRWSNQYLGYLTAVTTRGTSVATIRAAGPPGVHNIELSGLGIHGGGYLNNQQSPYARLFPEDTGSYRFGFTVTDDPGPADNELEWPDDDRLVQLAEDAPRTTITDPSPAPGVSAALVPDSGPILTATTLRASGLEPDAEVELVWMTARGNRVTPSGWEFHEVPLHTARSDGDGRLETEVEIPDGLGGWQSVQLVQDRQVVAAAPFYVQQSLVSAPEHVRLGEEFSITLKGVGWTEVDNTVGITYNNAYIGYACGFNSNGDVTVHLQAVGQPGTHLIDVYPTTYQGQGKRPWGFQMPHLSALTDHPSLDLGYRLPIHRISIEVVE